MNPPLHISEHDEGLWSAGQTAAARGRWIEGEREREKKKEREECPAIIFAASAGHSKAITSSHKSRPSSAARLG